jgi:hypothetical protein
MYNGIKELNEYINETENGTVNIIAGSAGHVSQWLMNLFASSYTFDDNSTRQPKYFVGLTTIQRIKRGIFSVVCDIKKGMDIPFETSLELLKLWNESNLIEYEFGKLSTDVIEKTLQTENSPKLIILDSIIGIIPVKTYNDMTVYEQERQVMIELKRLAIKYKAIIWIGELYSEMNTVIDSQINEIAGSKLKTQLADNVILHIPNSNMDTVGLMKLKAVVANGISDERVFVISIQNWKFGSTVEVNNKAEIKEPKAPQKETLEGKIKKRNNKPKLF